MQHQQTSRINVGELKAQIVKKLGAERSKQYFYYLNRFLNQKLSKSEFDKLCIRVLGGENLQLHNQFIRSILKNACQAKTPPPIHTSPSHAKSITQGACTSPVREDGHGQSGALFPNQNQNVPIWSNGVFPVSPRKGRSGIRDRKLKDRPNPLGPNGKVEFLSHQLTGTADSSNKVILDNGDATPCDYQRPVQHLRAVAELPETEKARMHSKIQKEAAVLVDGDEVDLSNRLSLFQRPLLAPLGIPFLSASIGGARKAFPVDQGGNFVSYYDSSELSDSEMLRKHMEQIAASHSLGCVSMECANMLNHILDVYLKGLIRSCVDLVDANSTCEPKKHFARENQIQGKGVNGIYPNNHLCIQSIYGHGPAEIMQEKRSNLSISLLDFKVAMELNPNQLGEDWSGLMEKICLRTFEE